ncbi:MAG: extracellular solute-binding protein [Epulopiscium sp.]|nr:extracellular solute-binding protein [Candidatus Epulonipiscium sp.]
MFKNKKAIISMLLFVLFLSSFLTGCANKKEVNTTGNNGSAKSKKEQEVQGKRKLKILAPNTLNQHIKFEDRENYPVWPKVKKLFDDANVELDYELIPFEQYQVVLQTRMASASDLPDIVTVTQLDNTTVLNLAKQKVLQDLNPLIESYSNGNIKKMYDVHFPYARALTTSPDGSMFWFSSLHQKTYQKNQPAPVSLSTLIRKDWLDKLNLPVPTTANEFLETLKEMRKQDANENGQEDEVLLYDPSGFGSAIPQWFGLGSAITAVDVENNKIVSPWYQPGIKEYFKYVKRLVEEEILDTSLIGGSYEQSQQKITENKASALVGYNLSNAVENTVKGGGEVLPLMPLQAVDGIKPATLIEPPFLVWEKYAITKNCKDVEAAIAFFDAIYSEEYADLSYWGIEGLTYKYDDDGNKLFKQNGTDEEKVKTGQVRGTELYGGFIFPKVQFANLEFELTPERVREYKVEQQLKVLTYQPYFVNMNNNYLAIPDDTQLERKTKILNDLNTYSAELATKLALGQNSLDDWDKYIADLKKLGLDELIEIDQALLDRYNELNSK